MSDTHQRAHHSYSTQHQLLLLQATRALRRLKYEFFPGFQFLEHVVRGELRLQTLSAHTV